MYLQENAEGGEKTKKIKRLTFAEMEALRGKRREARKNRPKSRFKGLSWSTTKGTWSVQVWDKSQGRVSSFPPLIFSFACFKVKIPFKA